MATQSIWYENNPDLSATRETPRILVIDDDEKIRNVIKAHLSGRYEVMETGDPEKAVPLTVAHRPDAILLDLSMPGVSGFELCRMLASLSFTRRIPIFIISGQDQRNSAFCLRLGASKYFAKPIDFGKLKEELAKVLLETKAERRSDVRFSLRVFLKLKGQGNDGAPLEIRATTENISRGGFLCACTASPEAVQAVEVFSCGDREYYLGQARLVRVDQDGVSNPRYAFQFVQS